MDRRTALKIGAGLGLAGLRPLLAGKTRFDKRDPQLWGTARNCVFINTVGGMSHVDTFDYKPGPATPNAMGQSRLSSGALWPAGIMPDLAARGDHFTLVRSLYGVERNHQRAQFAVETGHRFNPAASLRAEVPSLGSLISVELAGQRGADDVLPTFFAMGMRPPGTGMFPRQHNAYFLEVENRFDREFDAYLNGDIRTRLNWLWTLDPLKQEGHDPLGSRYLWSSAEALMFDERARAALTLDDERQLRYLPQQEDGQPYVSGRGIGEWLAQAYQLLAADSGTRFIHIGYQDWDRHSQVYGHLAYEGPLFDRALAAFFDEMSETPGVEAGKSLLDETLVVVVGEFGRTPGALNRLQGRDHFSDAFSALFAGGGVQGGRIIGATDAVGGAVIDNGWSHDRPIGLVDLSATVFSALGIDYRRSLADTPSGRTFYYVGRDSWAGTPHVIDPLFS
ncbi:DUF1501 domain-containing protein [Acanthopleuribacter pedis]|uniref:DUF1501 domain-containing protein n=1 Tax=Acanthopleuribacter pedis TaxID=442870 RepID=A0A8J7Q582_9BACT|nr:DUF1501 domain-containing protein [Acanthopleuribacter pedis]MBO1320647.1 DUF1501 domain-containing protein [Acanthopleuribacter pedis]